MTFLPGNFTALTTCIHSDTTDHNTTFVNSAPSGRVITGSSIEHSINRSKFGGSSIKPLNDYGFIEFIATNPLGLCIDFWVYIDSFPSTTKTIIAGGVSPGSPINNCYLQLGSSGILVWRWFYDASVKSGCVITGTVTAGQWNHIYAHASITDLVYTPITWSELGNTYNGITTSGNIHLQIATNGAVNSTHLPLNMNPSLSYSDSMYSAPSYISIGRYSGMYFDEIRNDSFAYMAEDFTPYTTPYPKTIYRVSGTVEKGTSKVSRTVCLYDRVTKKLIGTAQSSATTGAYEISNVPEASVLNKAFAVCLKETGDLESKIYDDITPVVSA